MLFIKRTIFFPLSCFESQLFNLSQGRWLWFQPIDAVTDQDNDYLQHLETVVCCYSCCIWRCFLDERSENHGAQQLFTKGILYHSVPLMWAFSLLLPFVVFFPLSFCSATPSVCPVLVKSVCSFMAPSASTFTLCTFHLVSKTTEWYASLSQSTPGSWMFVKRC